MSAKIEFEGKKYRVNGIEMNVVVEGQGRDLVLVHGFPDSIAVWRHRIPVLVSAGYRVIALDQRGFGLTEAPPMVTCANWWLWRKRIRYDPEFERWIAQLSRPGRLTAAINIYRANLKLMLPRNSPKVSVPVMGVWGEGDVALVEEQMIASEKYVSASWRYERIGDRSGHWLMLSAPDKFNAVLLDYLKANVVHCQSYL